MIRVMVVDDSPTVRAAVTRLLESDPGISVVAVAASGESALRELSRVEPDVITMDLQMPGMGGMAAIREIMRAAPKPVVVLSALGGTEATLQALELGAVDFVAKPSARSSRRIGESGRSLVATVKRASLVVPRIPPAPAAVAPSQDAGGAGSGSAACQIVAIGASTGGPVAVRQVLSELPAGFPLSVLVVQHMPAVFTRAFAARLASLCRLPVKEAQHGEPVRGGHVYIAPGDRHLSVAGKAAEARIRLSDTAPVNGHRPSVDTLAHSVAAAYAEAGLGLIMTGMGRDGARGMADIRKRGGRVIAQDQESSVIFGMNRAVIENGDANEVLPLRRIGERLRQIAAQADRRRP